jgi:ferrous iron transport protein B
LLFDGLVAGIGSVVIFLPQIVILFLAMGLLEDTGYLARGAMLVDKPLSLIGLNGRSFMPLLSGFACAIPAMMAARTISSRWERIATIFIIPLMSCSARLPVYSLLLAFLLPREKPWIGGIALSALYFLGLIWGAVFATLISKLPNFKKHQSSFLLELPAYRKPLFRVVWTSTLHRAMWYLKKAGPNIVLLSIGLWLLTHLPVTPPQSGKLQQNEYVSVEHSYAAKVGRILQPVMEPMGLDWRSGVALIMGFAAREVFVSSMALLYRIDNEAQDDAVQAGLLKRMKDVTFENSLNKIFTVSSVCGLLFFFTVALQCVPTVITAKSEIGSWKIPLIQWTVFSGVAYLGAVCLVQGLRFLGVP